MFPPISRNLSLLLDFIVTTLSSRFRLSDQVNCGVVCLHTSPMQRASNTTFTLVSILCLQFLLHLENRRVTLQWFLHKVTSTAPLPSVTRNMRNRGGFTTLKILKVPAQAVSRGELNFKVKRFNFDTLWKLRKLSLEIINAVSVEIFADTRGMPIFAVCRAATDRAHVVRCLCSIYSNVFTTAHLQT